jgi:hypothetical protein
VKRRKSILLTFAHGGMEICWIYACTSFFMKAILGSAVSLPTAMAIFVVAAVLSRFSRGRGWRVATLGGMHLVGYSCVSLFTLHGFWYAAYPFFGKEWIVVLLTAPKASMEWFRLAVLLIWTGLLWTGGVSLAMREKTYVRICTRFDIGLAAFFGLFLIKLVARVKGGMDMDDGVSSLMVYPFLILGLGALGVARAGHEGSKSWLPGRGGFGAFMSVVSLALLGASSLALFAIPGLTHVAEFGRYAVKGAALRILPFVTGVMRFMFMGGRVRPDPPSGSSPAGGEGWGGSPAGTWWAELLEKIMRWGIEVIVILSLAAVTAVLVYLTLRWLFSRTAMIPRVKADHGVSISWLARVRVFLAALWRALKKVTKGYSRAVELYSVLAEWGRRSGLPRLISETPLEFGARLGDRFPGLRSEIGRIISAFNIEAYGATSLTGEEFARALGAWRAVRSPVHWPRRFMSRLRETVTAGRR